MKLRLIPKNVDVSLDPQLDLRKNLLDHFAELYNQPMAWVHCRGMGTCGTCAIEILEGELSPPTKLEKWRLNFAPHSKGLSNGLRLACQAKPLSDLLVKKHPGAWGQRVEKSKENLDE